MPKYGIPQGGGVLTQVDPGEGLILFNAEKLTAPQAGLAFARGFTSPGPQPSGSVFTISFPGAGPTDSVGIQGANVDVDAEYQTLFTSTNLEKDYYNDVGEFAFYRPILLSGGVNLALTVIVQR